MSGHGHKKVKKGAKKQDIILMVVTFLVGIFAGSYLYVTAFMPQFSDLIGQTEEVYEDFVIEGEQYGGDRLGGTSPSFQLLDNGSFRYLPYSQNGTSAEIKEGNLAKSYVRDLKKVLTKENLENMSESVTKADCASFVDGIDYTYNITLDGADYIIDSCKTNLSDTSEVYKSLELLWEYFSNLE